MRGVENAADLPVLEVKFLRRASLSIRRILQVTMTCRWRKLQDPFLPGRKDVGAH